MKDAPPLVRQDDEDEQDLEHHGGDDEEVHGDGAITSISNLLLAKDVAAARYTTDARGQDLCRTM